MIHDESVFECAINQEAQKKCEQGMYLNHRSKEETSPYLMSDVEGVESTSAAWQSVAWKKNFYVGPVDKDAILTIKGYHLNILCMSHYRLII